MNLSGFVRKLKTIESHGCEEFKVIIDGKELTIEDIAINPQSKEIILRSSIINTEEFRKISKLKEKINKAISEFEL